VNNRKFWEELTLLHDILKPIVERLIALEGDCEPLSSVYKYWCELEEIFDPDAESDIKKNVRKKITDFLNSRWGLISERCFAASFLLDPRYRDRPVAVKDYRLGEELLKKYHTEADWPSVLRAFSDFREGVGIYENEANLEPVLFWRRLKNITETSAPAPVLVWSALSVRCVVFTLGREIS